MLWHIQGSCTYVLGSVHVTNQHPLQLPSSAEQAFVGATSVVFEADLDGTPDASLLSLPGNVQLRDVIPESIFRATHAHWLRLGLPESRLLSIRPGFAAMSLQFANASKNGYAPQFGVDRNLWDRAKLEGKQRLELEPFGEQLRMLAESPFDEQASLLDYIAGQDDVGLSELAGMVSAWSRGDLLHFEGLVMQRLRRWPLTFQVLITRRNTSWAPTIAALAGGGTPCLIVVGLLHLLGPTGLPSLLRQYGLTLAHRPDA